MPNINRPTVCFLQWSTHGREFEMDIPLMYFFSKELNWNVSYKSQFNLPDIIKASPDLVIMAATNGSNLSLKWAKIINQSSIPLFSHVAEGAFRIAEVEEFFWGHNKKAKTVFEELIMLWNEESYDMVLEKYPNLCNKVAVSGAVGFDKYSILQPKRQFRKRYKKVIGYAAFDFNNVYNQTNKKGYPNTKSQLNKCKSILRELIQRHEDILFIAKPHPSDQLKTPLELIDVLNASNLQITDEKDIFDVITSVDLWLSLNSTTSFEALLANRPSISFVTDPSEFCSKALDAVLNIDNASEISQAIDEYYETGFIRGYEKKKKLQDNVILKIAGHNDGLNHVRFMRSLKPYILEIERAGAGSNKIKIGLRDLFLGYIKHFIYSYAAKVPQIKFFHRWSFPYTRFNITEFENNKLKWFVDCDIFYNKNRNKIKAIFGDKDVEV